MADDKRRKLYDNLITSGKVSEDELGTFDTFDSNLDSEDNVAKLYNHLSNSFTEEQLGSLESFSSSVRLPKKKEFGVESEKQFADSLGLSESDRKAAEKEYLEVSEISTRKEPKSLAGFLLDKWGNRKVDKLAADEDWRRTRKPIIDADAEAISGGYLQSMAKYDISKNEFKNNPEANSILSQIKEVEIQQGRMKPSRNWEAKRELRKRKAELQSKYSTLMVKTVGEEPDINELISKQGEYSDGEREYLEKIVGDKAGKYALVKNEGAWSRFLYGYTSGKEGREASIQDATFVASNDKKDIIEKYNTDYKVMTEDVRRRDSGGLITPEGLGQMLGSQRDPIMKVMGVGVLTGGNPLAAGAVGASDAAVVSYGASFRDTYFRAKQKGLSDEVSYMKAIRQAYVAAAGGAFEGALGAINPFKVTGKGLANAFTKILFDTGIDASAAALSQFGQNFHLKYQELSNDLGEGVLENVLGEVIFSLGSNITSGARMYGGKLSNYVQTLSTSDQQKVAEGMNEALLRDENNGEYIDKKVEEAVIEEPIPEPEKPTKEEKVAEIKGETKTKVDELDKKKDAGEITEEEHAEEVEKVTKEQEIKEREVEKEEIEPKKKEVKEVKEVKEEEAEAKLKEIDEAEDAELGALDEQLEKETISDEDYEEAYTKAEEKYEKQREDIVTEQVKIEEDAKKVREEVKEAVPKEGVVEEEVSGIRVRDVEKDRVEAKEREIAKGEEIPSKVLVDANEAFTKTREQLGDADAVVESFKTVERSEWYKSLTPEQQARAKAKFLSETGEQFAAGEFRPKQPKPKVPSREGRTFVQKRIDEFSEMKKDLAMQQKSFTEGMRLGKKMATKKMTESVENVKKILTDFVEANKGQLTDDQYQKVISKISGAVTNKAQLTGLINYVNKATEVVREKVTKDAKRNIVRQGKKLKDPALREYFNEAAKMDADVVDSKIDGLDKELDKLNTKYTNTQDPKILEEIFKIQERMDVMASVGDLEAKSLDELIAASNTLADLDKYRGEQIKEVIENRAKKAKSGAKEYIKAVSGGVDLNTIRGSQEKYAGNRAKTSKAVTTAITKLQSVGEYLNIVQTFDYLVDRINRSWKLGKGKAVSRADFIGTKQAKAIRQGQNVEINKAKKWKDDVGGKVAELFGSNRNASKISTEKVYIPLEETLSDGAKQITEVPVSMGTIAHMNFSATSEANSGYLNRIGRGTQKFKATEATFEAITKALDTENGNKLIEFTEWLSDSFYQDVLPEVNQVFNNLTGTDIARLEGYLPIDGIKETQDFDDFGNYDPIVIYQSMMKNRVTNGRYDLDNNDVFSGAYNYVDKAAKFVGLAEPVSDIVSTLRNSELSDYFKATSTTGLRDAIFKLLSNKMTGGKQKINNRIIGLYRNFLTSKIKLNYATFPKQFVSIMAALDPDYVPPKYMRQSAFRGFDSEARKNVREVLLASGDLETRNMVDMETLYKSINDDGWGNKSAAKMRELIDKTVKGVSPERRESIARGLEYLYMPTKYGDRIAIKLAGRPLIDASYRHKLDMLKEEGVVGVKAEEIAKQHALFTFEKWMNQTQQTQRFTDKSLAQSGVSALFMGFKNSPSLYANKIIGAYGDMYKNYRAELDPTIPAGKRQLKALMKINKDKSFQKIMLYQFIMPVLFDQVGRGFKDIRMVIDGNEEEQKEGWKNLKLSAAFDWTKGLFLLGTFAEFTKRQLAGETYRETDNVLQISDDVFRLLENSVKILQGDTEEGAKLRKIYVTAVASAINLTGLPGEALKRGVMAATEYDRNTLEKTMLRSLGIPKVWLDEMYGEEPKKPKRKPSGRLKTGFQRAKTSGKAQFKR
jgi:hypothetical protein